MVSTINSDTLNKTIRYSGYFVYSRVGSVDADPESATSGLATLIDQLATKDVVVRGLYDVSGMRAGADLMIWWHAPRAQDLQAAGRSFRHTKVGQALALSWSAIGLHRPAEFNRAHIPAFLGGEAPRGWASVYPFVRSYEWYLLPDNERRALISEHGLLGRDHPKVCSSTVSAFALGDYEWLLALESDDLADIVDMMRHLRTSATRRHIREEVPFFTGRRIGAAEAAAVLA